MFSTQHYGGRLFQQYYVNAFSKIEEERLDYLRKPKMQAKLRASTYSQLKKHLEYREQRSGSNVLLG